MTQQEIESNNGRFCEALGSRDLETIAGLYDDQATLIAPGVPPIHGIAAIRDYYTGVFGAGVTGATLRTTSLDEAGDALVEVGAYEMAVSPPGGAEAFEDAGKYMHVYRRRPDGGWALWKDMFHSDGAAS